MEASQAGSAFEQGVEDTGSDPFGDNGMGDFAQGGEETPPVVDREGNVIEPGSLVPEDTAGEAGAETSVVREQREADEARERREADEEFDKMVPSEAPADAVAPPVAAAAASSEEPGEAAGSEAKKATKGKGDARRRYVVFAVDGPGKFSEVAWYEKDGEMVTKGVPGSKRQTVCLVHDTAEALAVGYLALGSPTDGCNLVAVAATYFRIREVKPKQQKPSRMALSIS